MSTQPLGQESSLRKPSRIGEEIRKELEKRGLRAPKYDQLDPNGTNAPISVETPIQIAVKEGPSQEIDIEVKPVDKVEAGDVEHEERASLEIAEDQEIVEVIEEAAETQPLSAPDADIAEGTHSDLALGSIQLEPGLDILLLDEDVETEVDFGPWLVMEEETRGDEPVLEEQPEGGIQIVAEVGEFQAEVVSSDLSEDSNADLETDAGHVTLSSSEKTSEPASAQFERSGHLDNLLSVASLELRSPLQAISGYLELLVDKDSTDILLEEQYLNIAYRESNHLSDIIADLEIASLIESGQFQITSMPIAMDSMLQSCVQRFDQLEWEGQIFLEDARLKILPHVEGDEIYMRQALNNLIGAVLRPLRAGHNIFIRTVLDEDNLILQVVGAEEFNPEDTLPDIRAEGEEAYDLSQEGLGVFVARHIIEAHGGALLAQGTEFEGLSFTIQLPTKPREQTRGTILITEDNTHAAQLMEYALERDGYVPIKAMNGLEALEIVANDSVDLVILDVVLPGMDGFEVCYRMRSSTETASIPVVIVSAKSGDEYKAKALRVGADAYFNKPLVLADLLSTMEKLLESGGTGSPEASVDNAES